MPQLITQVSGKAIGKTNWNLSVPELYERAIQNDRAQLSDKGALTAKTGSRTGRSPRDKWVVEEPATSSKIWWGKVNQPMKESVFDHLLAKVMDYLAGKELYVLDSWAGADPKLRVPIRLVNDVAWHSLFAHQLFRRTTPEEQKQHQPEWTIYGAPYLLADPKTDGTNSEVAICIHFTKKKILILGTQYAGEIKKSIFTVMNYLLPLQGVLSMHCSANVGEKGDVALFFGLSGTGKTTLSADPARGLIGDDEHGWSDDGVFNIEGGCYAKCVGLSREREPQIWDAVRFGSVIENVVVNPTTRMPDYNDRSITENTRVAYPLDYIEHAVPSGMGGHPKAVIFLSSDAFGVLPPIARLSPEQAMYHFMSGYTAALAGTESGQGKEPKPTFSTCFGAPFLPLLPSVYAQMLAQKLKQHQASCWLVNTGWTNGPYGTCNRIPLAINRAAVTAVLNGTLDKVEYEKDPVFGFEIPKHCPGVPDNELFPRKMWKDTAAYDIAAKDLADKFKKNFEQYKEAPPAILHAGPL